MGESKPKKLTPRELALWRDGFTAGVNALSSQARSVYLGMLSGTSEHEPPREWPRAAKAKGETT